MAVSDRITIKLQGALVVNLTKIDPTWEQHITYQGKKKVLTIYSKALKVLYGTVDASKRFYDNLSGLSINKLGFKRNEHDQYVVSKTINNSQCTVVWHVDDLEISHNDSNVVLWVIDQPND